VGKKRFGGATWERSCCSPLPGRNARLDVAVFSRFATPAPVRIADSPSNRSFRGAGLYLDAAARPGFYVIVGRGTATHRSGGASSRKAVCGCLRRMEDNR